MQETALRFVMTVQDSPADGSDHQLRNTRPPPGRQGPAWVTQPPIGDAMAVADPTPVARRHAGLAWAEAAGHTGPAVRWRVRERLDSRRWTLTRATVANASVPPRGLP
jgi:hypothetical protein